MRNVDTEKTVQSKLCDLPVSPKLCPLSCISDSWPAVSVTGCFDTNPSRTISDVCDDWNFLLFPSAGRKIGYSKHEPCTIQGVFSRRLLVFGDDETAASVYQLSEAETARGLFCIK